MNADQIISDIAGLGLNLYDIALYTPKGILSRRCQPCSNCHNSYSVAKVFIMTALGMLWDEGRIHMDDPLGKYFVFPQKADRRLKDATIEHAVTHFLGFDEGFLDIDSEDASQYPTEDYLSIVLSHPLAHAPGTHRQYSDAAYYLLSRLVSRIADENADTLLNRRLLRPLRFREAAWSHCPLDYPIGATGLYIGAQDMVKLGTLYLHDGVYEGKRLLSKEWVQTAIAKEYELHPLSAEGSSADLIGKWGMYGQLLVFSKEKQFAFACHAHMDRDAGAVLTQYLSEI